VPKVQPSSESAPAVAASVPTWQYTSTQASLLAGEPDPAPLLELAAPAAGVARLTDSASRAAQATSAEPGASARRAPERASSSEKFSPSPARTQPALGEAPHKDPTPSPNADSAASGAAPVAAPAVDGESKPPEDFPFVTSNPYGAH
jgi:hypothetical protein